MDSIQSANQKLFLNSVLVVVLRDTQRKIRLTANKCSALRRMVNSCHKSKPTNYSQLFLHHLSIDRSCIPSHKEPCRNSKRIQCITLIAKIVIVILPFACYPTSSNQARVGVVSAFSQQLVTTTTFRNHQDSKHIGFDQSFRHLCWSDASASTATALYSNSDDKK